MKKAKNLPFVLMVLAIIEVIGFGCAGFYLGTVLMDLFAQTFTAYNFATIRLCLMGGCAVLGLLIGIPTFYCGILRIRMDLMLADDTNK